MGEWECLLVAKASLDQEKTRVLVEIQWTMGDLTLKLHAQPPSINHNDDEQQTNNACLSLSKPATLAVCKNYLSALQTNYKPSKSAGTRLENIPHVVDLAAFPAPHLYPLNADLTNDQRVRQTASMPKPSPLRIMAFLTPKSSVNSVLRLGGEHEGVLLLHPFFILFTFWCRSSPRTLKSSMGFHQLRTTQSRERAV